MTTFRARESNARIYLVLLMLFFMILEVVCIIGLMQTSKLIIFIPAILFCLAGAIIFMMFLGWYPSMRYEIKEDKVKFSCGPLKSEIPLDKIIRIENKDLAYDITSTGFKFPGYSLFNVKYADEGVVRMYASATLKDIVLIETEEMKYGITPKDKKEFLELLTKKKSLISSRDYNIKEIK